MKTKIERIIKENKIVNKIFTKAGSFFFSVVRFFIKKEPKTILFVSYMGKGFNDSPKLIYDQIIKDEFFSDFTFYIALNNPKEEVGDSRTSLIKMDSWNYFKTALKAEYWVTNVNIERGLHFKPQDTIFVNTWHGIPFKKVGNDVKGRSDFDFSSVNYFCYSGQYEYPIYKRAFNVEDDNLYKIGLPRNDIIYDTNKCSGIINQIKKEYHVEDKKIILYAPTWREEGGANKELDYDLWQEQLGKDYVVFIRSHGLAKTMNLGNSDFFIDVSDYSETADLILAADLLVTDYSSIMFDYSLTDKPIFLYTYDYEEYKRDRGVYFELKDIPLRSFSCEEQLTTYIAEYDLQEEKNRTKEFKEMFFDNVSGNATSTIVDYIKKEAGFNNED